MKHRRSSQRLTRSQSCQDVVTRRSAVHSGLRSPLRPKAAGIPPQVAASLHSPVAPHKTHSSAAAATKTLQKNNYYYPRQCSTNPFSTPIINTGTTATTAGSASYSNKYSAATHHNPTATTTTTTSATAGISSTAIISAAARSVPNKHTTGIQDYRSSTNYNNKRSAHRRSTVPNRQLSVPVTAVSTGNVTRGNTVPVARTGTGTDTAVTTHLVAVGGTCSADLRGGAIGSPPLGSGAAVAPPPVRAASKVRTANSSSSTAAAALCAATGAGVSIAAAGQRRTYPLLSPVDAANSSVMCKVEGTVLYNALQHKLNKECILDQTASGTTGTDGNSVPVQGGTDKMCLGHQQEASAVVNNVGGGVHWRVSATCVDDDGTGSAQAVLQRDSCSAYDNAVTSWKSENDTSLEVLSTPPQQSRSTKDTPFSRGSNNTTGSAAGNTSKIGVSYWSAAAAEEKYLADVERRIEQDSNELLEILRGANAMSVPFANTTGTDTTNNYKCDRIGKEKQNPKTDVTPKSSTGVNTRDNFCCTGDESEAGIALMLLASSCPGITDSSVIDAELLVASMQSTVLAATRCIRRILQLKDNRFKELEDEYLVLHGSYCSTLATQWGCENEGVSQSQYKEDQSKPREQMDTTLSEYAIDAENVAPLRSANRATKSKYIATGGATGGTNGGTNGTAASVTNGRAAISNNTNLKPTNSASMGGAGGGSAGSVVPAGNYGGAGGYQRPNFKLHFNKDAAARCAIQQPPQQVCTNGIASANNSDRSCGASSSYTERVRPMSVAANTARRSAVTARKPTAIKTCALS